MRNLIPIQTNPLPLDLPSIGISLRYNCNFCGGYKTLSITNNDGVIQYNCFKASCTNKGTLTNHLNSQNSKEVGKHLFNFTWADTQVQYLYETVFSRFVNLPVHAVQFLHNLNPTIIPTTEKLNIFLMYDPKTNRIVIGERDIGREGQTTGRTFTGRYIGGSEYINKWYHYSMSKYVSLYYDNAPTRTLLIVEDALSAIVALNYNVKSLALLGTSLLTRNLNTCVSLSYSTLINKIIIALDKDATDKAVKIHKELVSEVYSECKVEILLLEKDIKNCTGTELTLLLENVG